MEKRNGYKVKSVCQPVMGTDLALIEDARRKQADHFASVKTLKREAVFVTDRVEKVVYKKSEHGNVNI